MIRAKKSGSIIQLSSIYGIVGQDLSIYKGTKMKESMSYSIIKGGINNLTRQMASFYGQFSIRVNTISPGGVEGKIAGHKNKQSSKFIKIYSRKTALKRMAHPDDIAPAVVFLVSDAGSYITGFNLIIDGGWTII